MSIFSIFAPEHNCALVNERSAMQMTAVYACVRILCEAIEACRFISTAATRTAAGRSLLRSLQISL